MTKKWLRERERDYYHRLAREEGYRSRAAYKLLQIAEKYNFINRGDVIVDLGAAPGGWIQAARKLVGAEGYILSIDRKPIKDFDLTNVSFILADVERLQGLDILPRLPGEPDVVLSDLSPDVSGVWDLDHSRQIYLAEISLNLAIDILRAGGNFLVKAFHGSSLKELVNKIKAHFRIVRIVKPKASRKKSAEVYILALDFNRRHKID